MTARPLPRTERRAGRGRGVLVCWATVWIAASLGCAGTQLTQSSELEATRKRQDDLLSEIRQLRELNQVETERRMRAEAEMEETLADFDARFERLEFQLKDLLDGLAREQARGATMPPPADGVPRVVNPDADTGLPPGDGEGIGGDPLRSGPAQTDPRAEYDAAYLEVTRGHFDDAIAAFDAFLARHPATELSDNAMYWVGECHYASQRYDRAIDAFVRLMDSYPDGDKVPAAMLKLGYAFRARGDIDASRRYLEALVAQHPNSDEAGLALKRLDEL